LLIIIILAKTYKMNNELIKDRAVPYKQITPSTPPTPPAPSTPPTTQITLPTTSSGRKKGQGRKPKLAPSDWRTDQRVQDILANYKSKGQQHWELYKIGYPARIIAEITGASLNTISVDITRKKKLEKS
jgi:hypothetical protein